jgi:hypothetical protein
MTQSILNQDRVYREDEQAECYNFVETCPSFLFDRQNGYKYYLIQNIETDLVYGVYEGKDKAEAWYNCRGSANSFKKKDVFNIPLNVVIEEISEADIKANAEAYREKYHE